MALKTGQLGMLMMAAVDSLSPEQKKNRIAVFNAMGSAIESYLEVILKGASITVPPLPGFGSTTTPGNPTGPGATVVIPPGSIG